MRNILIYGLGKSGLAVRKFFNNKSENLFLFDDNKNINDLKDFDLKNLDLAIVSPGVSEDNNLYKKLEENSVKIISELELGFQNVEGEIIAVTGTNGKTTTVSLIGHILKHKDENSFVAGNIGIPLISLCGETNKNSKIVCEVSSFQLMKIEKFRPKISAILNLAPDHITRHKSFENYISAKCRIFENQTQEDLCVLNYDDKCVKKINNKIVAKIYYFSHKNQEKNKNFIGIYYNNGNIYYKNKNNINFIMSAEKIKLIGEKNLENILCAILISIFCNIEISTIKETVNSFLPLHNRLETVLIKNGVAYINDSKATNIASTIADVDAVQESIVLLLGGSDKGEDFRLLFRNLTNKIHKCIIYGATKEDMIKCADEVGYTNYALCENFELAVKAGNEIAKGFAKKGGKIALLLAPACASFDEFKNYEERGKFFKNLINKINN